MSDAVFIQDGRYMLVTATADIVRGEVIVRGNFVGVATVDIANGETGIIDLEGVYEVTKESPLVITQGDLIYWDDTANEADKTNTNVFMGVAYASAASAATVVQVKLGNATA